MSPITGNPSLFAHSQSRFLNRVPCGSPASVPMNRVAGEESGFPRSHPYRPVYSRVYPFSTCLFPDGPLTTCIHNKEMQPAIYHFGQSLSAALALRT